MTTMVRIGDDVTRVEDVRFLTGTGRYIADIKLDGQLEAVFLRSPVAHARITQLDVAAARAAPGVRLVVTGNEWVAAGYGPIPTKCPVRTSRDGTPIREPEHHCLAVGTVRHVGEPIVMVVADTHTQALDALELIEIDFSDIAPVVDQRAALAEGAPVLWDVAPSNVCLDFELGERTATEAAIAAADHVVTLDIRNNRVTAVAMEPRGCVASYDRSTGKFTLWNSSQNIHANRDVFAEQILKISKQDLRHVAPDVGGGFGAKNSLYAEPPLVLHAARALGVPVRWVADRGEAFLTDTHGRDQVSTVTLALDADGTFRALKVSTIGNIGAWCGTMGPFTPTAGSARTQGGPYAFPAMLYEAEAVFTNTAQTDPYRGAGRPEASFHVERIIDFAAAKLGFDPIELRRKNLIKPEQLPWKTPMGLLIDSGNFPELLDRTLDVADFAGFPARAAAARASGRRRGFAIAPYLECTGGMPKEEARISVEADGTVRVDVGSHSTGMSHETVLAQIVSDRLGLPLERISYRQADTDATAIGGGHGGSRGMEVGGNAVLKAADAFVEKLAEVAAHAMNSTRADISISDGSARDTRTGQTLAMTEVLGLASDPTRLPPALAATGVAVTEVYERDRITIPNGVHAAEVEVDPETGQVAVVGFWAIDDFGKILNRLLCDGQVMGGVAQGLGQALFEEIVYDPDSGQLLTGSLMDYCLPRADDMPPLHVYYYEEAPTTHNPLGVKGAGEAGCCGAPPAIVNAVLDALKEHGVTHLDMPLTPEKVWRALNNGRA
ncbi:MAG: xanthine dehydrogenase family protein molybdopterin-binding subunit [Hyphomicrobiaceae bacterium]